MPTRSAVSSSLPTVRARDAADESWKPGDDERVFYCSSIADGVHSLLHCISKKRRPGGGLRLDQAGKRRRHPLPREERIGNWGGGRIAQSS